MTHLQKARVGFPAGIQAHPLRRAGELDHLCHRGKFHRGQGGPLAAKGPVHERLARTTVMPAGLGRQWTFRIRWQCHIVSVLDRLKGLDSASAFHPCNPPDGTVADDLSLGVQNTGANPMSHGINFPVFLAESPAVEQDAVRGVLDDDFQPDLVQRVWPGVEVVTYAAVGRLDDKGERTSVSERV